MAEKRKMIAVCLAEAHSYLNIGFLDELNRAAAREGYGVTVFNSSLDLSWYQKEDNAPRAIYRAIRFELFDAVVMICHTFHDDDLIRQIARGAAEHDVPVILAGKELPGCYTVVNDFDTGFKNILRHVIRDHGARDTYFMAGYKNEENSEARLQCYREVLEEFGLPFSPSQVGYGNYWADPAAEIIRRMIRERKKMPDAIFCANDFMAIAVCDTLRENGIRVPEDVRVTGFDGIPFAYMVRPRLTTCSENPKQMADAILDLLRKRRAGEPTDPVLYHPFTPVFSESCGCPGQPNERYDALKVYRQNETLSNHENSLYHRVELMLFQNTTDAFLDILSSTLLPDSTLYLNRHLPGLFSGFDFVSDRIEESLLRIPCRKREDPFVAEDCRLNEVLPPEDGHTGLHVFQAIHAGPTVCGFFVTHTQSMENDAQLIRRLSDVLNLVFNIRIANARQQQLISHLDNSFYLDSVTGLNNLKGLTRWFEHYCAAEENHLRPLALSVYNIRRYEYIYENYGMKETEEIARLVASRLTSANPDAQIIARIGTDQFAVIDSAKDIGTLGQQITRGVEDFYRQIESYNAISTRSYYVEVNSGCTSVDPGWQDAALENLIRLALGEVYLNRLRSASDRTAAKSAATHSEFYSAFNLLMEKNLFRFHFQPIVDARSAQIYAYEALIRTDSLINLSPKEILAVAREYNRLYDVETATLFGIIEHFVQHYNSFCGCKVFINTIPGHFLTEEDCRALISQYESYLDCFVFEVTEQDTVPEEELSRLKRLCKPGGTARIAIDDFGTGHSNIVNVLRYAPQIIKIDRELISGIHNDQNKQLFVRNTIDFAHQNGIRALAEGVETAEDLRTVIDLGIDLIQGFFTGRPAAKPIPAVSDLVRHEILSENLHLTRFDRETKVYAAKDGEKIDLLKLATDRYTAIQFREGHVTLTGSKNHSTDMLLQVAEDSEVTLTLKDVNLKGVNEPPIQLGRRSRLTLQAEGLCTLNKDGILVPASAALLLQGGGELRILNSRSYSVGIGANYNDAYGSIVLDMSGVLTVQSSGDKIVCIGGGRSANDGISLQRGTVRLSASGINVVGVGSSTGDAQVSIGEASLSVMLEGNDALGIGSMNGQARIRSEGILEIRMNCERVTGIGTMSGFGDVFLDGGAVSANVHCDVGACIGTFGGEASVRCRDTRIRIHGEGNRVAGIGSAEGACDSRIDSGDVEAKILADTRLAIGNDRSRLIITGGNVRLFPEGLQPPVSPGGKALRQRTPLGDHFEQACRDGRESWTYTADRSEDGVLCVWLPEPD